MNYYFIHDSAEGTKGAFAQVTSLFPLSVILHDKCFISSVILSILQHTEKLLKLKVSLQEEHSCTGWPLVTPAICRVETQTP